MLDEPAPHYIERDNGVIDLIRNIPEKLEIAVAEEPLGPSGKIGKFPLVFAKHYAEKMLEPGRKILVINAGVGGAGFFPDGWGVGNVLYTRLVKMVKEAMQYNEQNRIVAFLWHQGENDSLRNPDWSEEKRYQVHKDNLMTMMNDFKQTFSLHNLPFVSAGFCDEWYLTTKATCDAVLRAVKDCCEEMHGIFIPTNGLLSNNEKTGNGDNIHFCRESLHILGKRYYDAYVKIVSEHFFCEDMKWIWLPQGEGVNQYAEFSTEFDLQQGKCVELYISAPTQYAIWVNGTFVDLGQYGDFPFYKVYDKLDISSYVKAGRNRLCILSYNVGVDTFVYYLKTPALCFTVTEDEKVVCYSDKRTRSRLSTSYISGAEVDLLAPPSGYTVAVDLTKQDAWKETDVDGFAESVEVDTGFVLYERPILKPQFQDAEDSILLAQGVFKDGGGNTVGQKAQYAYLSARTQIDMTGVARETQDTFPYDFTFRADQGDGIYAVIDLTRNRAGHIHFNITVDEDCDAIISLGEHLSDMRVRAYVGGRNYALSFRLKKGTNEFTETMRRVSGRYMMIYIYAKKATVSQLSVLEYSYPFQKKPIELPDGLKKKIYDVGVRTLELCFHEHYEDCPMREQALYGQDGRNQMLFGYDVFEGTDVQRESLRILGLAHWSDMDALMTTSPGYQLSSHPHLYNQLPIFSLYWVLAVCEYYEHTKDIDFVLEMRPRIDAVIAEYRNRTDEKGVKCFPAPYFNFYEWSDGMEPGTNANIDVIDANTHADKSETHDCPPTALLSYVLTLFANILEDAGEDSDSYRALSEVCRNAMTGFYDEEDGYYYSYIGTDGKRFGKHELVQALAMFCIDSDRNKRIAEQIIQKDSGLVRCTLSVLVFKYEGIIKALGQRGLKWVLQDLEDIFGNMCFQGYTTFPEMEGGEKIFEDAGSLCHGWSAIGCYIYRKYL